MPLHPWMTFDEASETGRIAERMREAVVSQFARRGAVVAVSGGIDSSVCAALAKEAFGKKRVYALLLPERDSSSSSIALGKMVCDVLGLEHGIVDIAPTLEAIGCYRWRDEAIRSVVPAYGDGWKSKIVIARNLLEEDRLNFFRLVVEDPEGRSTEIRLPLAAYLQIVAATNFKQRIRKTLEYFHADRLNYAVVGTPNRLEYDQGFFVRNGDGAADVKPIAHLYKSQVYALGRHLGLPKDVLESTPTTDTYSLPQGQDEFYFVLPYAKMDLVLFGVNNGKTLQEIAGETGLSIPQAERVVRDIETKRRTTRPLHKKAVLVGEVKEIPL